MRPPIVFLNVVTKALLRQMLLSDNFFMNTKFVDLSELYKLGFHKKVVTQKHLPLQGFATSTLRNSIGRRALVRCLCMNYEAKLP